MKAYKSKKAGENIIKTYDSLLKEWGIPIEEQMITTCYGDTHVIVYGKEDGLPLVLFHGGGDDSAIMWIYNARVLNEHFRLYAIDTIGGPGKSIMGKKYNKNFDDSTMGITNVAAGANDLVKAMQEINKQAEENRNIKEALKGEVIQFANI